MTTPQVSLDTNDPPKLDSTPVTDADASMADTCIAVQKPQQVSTSPESDVLIAAAAAALTQTSLAASNAGKLSRTQSRNRSNTMAQRPAVNNPTNGLSGGASSAATTNPTTVIPHPGNTVVSVSSSTITAIPSISPGAANMTMLAAQNMSSNAQSPIPRSSSLVVPRSGNSGSGGTLVAGFASAYSNPSSSTSSRSLTLDSSTARPVGLDTDLPHSNSFRVPVGPHRPSSRNGSSAETFTTGGESVDISKVPGLSGSHSFAHFRKTDIHPKRERSILFALHLKHSNQVSLGVGSSGQDVMLETLETQKDKKEKLSKRSAALSKLNALLRSKKKKKTRGGTMHNLTLAIHDRRITYANSLIAELSLNSLRKKRPHEANKIFLYAMANRLESVCLAFLEKGFPCNINAPIFGPANPDLSKFNFPTYFILAVALGLDNMARYMLKQKGNVNASWYRITPLVIACCKGNMSVVQWLVESGANINVSLPLSYYFLLRGLHAHDTHSSTGVRDPPVSRGSISAICGEPINMSDFGSSFKQFGDHAPVRFSPEYIEGKSLLLIEIAAVCGNKDVVKYLLPRTDIRLLAASSFSLLVQNDVETTLYLIKCGVNLNQRDASGSTALHLAARAGKLDQVVALVLSKVDVNLVGQNDWTALHEAVGFCRKDVVQYLLKKGADINAKTSSGETPADIAQRLGFSADELGIYFERQIDDAFLKRKEDSISSMSKLIQVNNDMRPLGVFPLPSSNSLLGNSGSNMTSLGGSSGGRESRKSSKSGAALGSGESVKRKGSDKFPSLPSFLTRSNNASASGASTSTGSGVTLGTSIILSLPPTSNDNGSTSSSGGSDHSSFVSGSVTLDGSTDPSDLTSSPKFGKPGKRKLFGSAKKG
ncbi:hypothetical protein QVD99_000257 [Batrachochytrium dendrobatidis]|nr:hypothetical protein O5D80_006493 [Batrachochytrium dendrobatidis]KAK5672758.1 hypothetical protein QVD99_000257 [Batrachochytrium dendrobatidis]